jgi:hypothetical protein
MNWFKVEINKGKEGMYNYVGSSEDSAETLINKAQNGIFVRLDNLLYYERGEIREWADWDKSLEPNVYINPKEVVSVMEFKGDPRVIPSK